MKIGKWEIEQKMFILIVLSSFAAASIAIVNFVIFTEKALLFSITNILAIFIAIFPIFIFKYMDYARGKEVEEMFPVFLRDFIESIRGGMSVPHAMKSVTKNDYKALTPHIKKMAAQMDWGIPADKVLMKFGRNTKSKLIMRVISSVVESHNFGGNLTDTFEALSNTALEVDRLRAERRLYMNSQLMTGYIIFFVFLAVIIGMEKYLIPVMTTATPGSLGLTQSPAAMSQEALAAEYKKVFMNLIVIQGLFSGLTVGKMSEGSMMSGVKHSLFMAFAGALAYSVSGFF